MPQKLTPQIVSAAIAGFQQQKLDIDKQIAELRSMLPGASAETNVREAPATKGHKMSPLARKRIAEAMKARWAKIRGESGTTAKKSPKPAAKKKGRISEEGMKRIIAATKKRWAAVRAAQKSVAATKAAPKAKRKLSPEARARVVANLKKAREAKAAKAAAAS